MATISESDITIQRTTTNDQHRSLGGVRVASSITWISDRTKYDEYLFNLFDKIRPNDIANIRSMYRCIAIYNGSSDTAWENVKAWIHPLSNYQEELTVELLGEAVVSTKVQQVADQYTAPTGDFKEPTSKGHADVIDLGNIAFSEWAALWIKITPTVDAKGRSYEELVIRIEGDDENASTSYVGVTPIFLFSTMTSEIEETLKRLNDIPERRVEFRGVQEYYDDSQYLVNQLCNDQVTDAQKHRVAMARTTYLAYQQYTIEIERAGGGLPPMVVSRVYELRRIMNEMLNSITGSSTRMEIHALKGRSQRGRTF